MNGSGLHSDINFNAVLRGLIMKSAKFYECKGILLAGCLVRNEGGNIWAKWESMDTKHEIHHLVNREQAYEVWFYTSDGDFVFTGVEVKKQKPNTVWEYIDIPAVMYAIFEVDYNNNPEPQIASIDKWLDENKSRYERFLFNANSRMNTSNFDVCYFDHGGKFGKEKIMEIRVPLMKIDD